MGTVMLGRWVCSLGVLLGLSFGGLWTQTPEAYEHRQRVQDILIMLSRHDRLLRVNQQYKRSPSKMFAEVPDLIEVLGEDAGSVRIQPKVSVVFSEYSPGVVVRYDLTKIKGVLEQSIFVVVDSGVVLHPTLEATLSSVPKDRGLEKQVLLLVPFLFDAEGKAQFASMSEARDGVRQQVQSLTKGALDNWYQDFYVHHQRQRVRSLPKADGRRWKKADDGFVSGFVEGEIARVPVEVMQPNTQEEKRAIGIEEVASRVFSIFRGNFGKDCSATTAPYFSLIKRTRTYWIHQSKEITAHPDGYVFLAEVAYGGRTLPYVINLNGPNLNPADTRQVLAQIAFDYNTRQMIIPDMDVNSYLVNYSDIKAGYRSYDSTGITVMMPGGWDAIQQSRVTEEGYFKAEKLQKARLISIPAEDWSHLAKTRAKKVIDQPYPSVESIKTKSALDRALIVVDLVSDVEGNWSFENEMTDLVRANDQEPFAEQVRLIRELKVTSSEKPLTADLVVSIQKAFAKSGQELSFRNVLMVLSPQQAIEQFNRVRFSEDASKVLPSRQKARRLAGSLYALIQTRSDMVVEKLSLYDLLSETRRLELIKHVSSVGDYSWGKVKYIAPSVLKDVETQLKRQESTVPRSELLSAYVTIFTTRKEFDRPVKEPLVVEALAGAASVPKRLSAATTFYRVRQKDLKAAAWGRVVDPVVTSVDLQDEKLQKQHWGQYLPDVLKDIITLHPVLPEGTKLSVADAVVKHADENVCLKYFTELHKCEQPAFLRSERFQMMLMGVLEKLSVVKGVELLGEVHERSKDVFSQAQWETLVGKAYEGVDLGKLGPKVVSFEPLGPKFLERSLNLHVYLTDQSKISLFRQMIALGRSDVLSVYIVGLHNADPVFVRKTVYRVRLYKALKSMNPVHASLTLVQLCVNHGDDFGQNAWGKMFKAQERQKVGAFKGEGISISTYGPFSKARDLTIKNHSTLPERLKLVLLYHVVTRCPETDVGDYLLEVEKSDEPFVKAHATEIFHWIESARKIKGRESQKLLEAELMLAGHFDSLRRESVIPELSLRAQSSVLSGDGDWKVVGVWEERYGELFSAVQWEAIKTALSRRIYDAFENKNGEE